MKADHFGKLRDQHLFTLHHYTHIYTLVLLAHFLQHFAMMYAFGDIYSSFLHLARQFLGVSGEEAKALSCAVSDDADEKMPH